MQPWVFIIHYICVFGFYRYPYKRQSEIIHIELFSTASFQFLRSILGCSQDYISQVTIAGGGSHIVAFCPTPHSATTEIIIWNLETEDHKHMARFPGLLAHGLSINLLSIIVPSTEHHYDSFVKTNTHCLSPVPFIYNGSICYSACNLYR